MISAFDDSINDYQPPSTYGKVDMAEEMFQHVSDDYPEVGLGENKDRGIPEGEPFPHITPRDYGPKPTNPSPLQATGKEEFGHQVETEPKTEEDFHTALKAQENSIGAGKDSETGLWSPHESLEGGSKTLGYGHKLTPRESKGGYVMIFGDKVDLAGGLTDDQIETLYIQDVGLAEKRLEKTVKGFETLPDKYKRILTNISFNVGDVKETGWPKLLKAMRSGDDETVRKEMVTSYRDKEGNRKQLNERATAIADATLG